MKNKVAGFLKKLILVLFLILITFSGYVAIMTRNTKDMTIRQRVLKTVYPAFTWWNKLVGKNVKMFSNEEKLKPAVSLYDLVITLNNGERVPLSVYKGKKLMLVNTASDCGFTDQYDDLQKLYESNRNLLEIIGFPANDFKQQEQGTDEEIASFCKLNYGITFPLATKSSVVAGPDQNPVYQWLTDKTRNGWTNKKPSWNFSKYLVNEDGILVAYFDPSVSPLSKEVEEAILK